VAAITEAIAGVIADGAASGEFRAIEAVRATATCSAPLARGRHDLIMKIA
jgi:hypothetical protein